MARALGRTRWLSEDDRIALARRDALAHLERGEQEAAEAGVRKALEGVDRPRKRADLLHDVTAGVLASGHEPGLLAEAVRALLGLADLQLAKGRTTLASKSFARAAALAFDRSVQFDTTMSPLARDARDFSAGFETSTFARALRKPRGRSGTPTNGPTTRVVVATRGNDNFLGELLPFLEETPGVTARHLDFAADREMSRGIASTATVAEEILTGRPGMAGRVERALRPHLDSADVLFVEWCSALAVLAGLVDPKDTRVVVRLHSYEAFTRWPHLLDPSRVDDLVFVSELTRDLAVDAVPGLREPGAPRLHVLPLAQDLQVFVRPKPDAARFTLALVGWASMQKDPLWALEVLRRVREHDERYHLLLVGSDFDPEPSAAAARYGARLFRELEELEAAGAVRRLGQTDDVPAALAGVGVIVSSSVREGCHTAMQEGAASGAVPVVRDWPFFAGRPTGVRSLVPADWVVETPEEAARRVLETTADPGVWREAGAAASREALARWDWAQVRPLYERLLLG